MIPGDKEESGIAVLFLPGRGFFFMGRLSP
jgi:hypothetical protein